ncbi:hypothetical protein D3C80_1450550 [compost metagenome]
MWIPPKEFIGAFPKIIIPPQSPGFLLFISFSDVKTIGSVSSPSATILEPLVITSVPQVLSSPLMTVPGSIVRVALLVTYTTPTK